MSVLLAQKYAVPCRIGDLPDILPLIPTKHIANINPEKRTDAIYPLLIGGTLNDLFSIKYLYHL